MKPLIDALDNIAWAKSYLEQVDTLLCLEQRLGGTDYFDEGEFTEKARKIIHLVKEDLLPIAIEIVEEHSKGLHKQ